MTIAPPAPPRARSAAAAPPDAGYVPAGGVGRRLVAYLVDALVVAVPGLGVWFATSSVLLAAVVSAEIAVALVVWEARSGRTVGKHLLGIRAAQVDRPYAPGLGRELVRASLLALGHLVAGIGQLVLILSAAGDRQGLGRGWHDRVARTRVVDVRPGVRARTAPVPAGRAPATAHRPVVLPPPPGSAPAPQRPGPVVPAIPQAPSAQAPAPAGALPFPTPAPHETTSGQEARRIAAGILGQQQPQQQSPPPYAARLGGTGTPPAAGTPVPPPPSTPAPRVEQPRQPTAPASPSPLPRTAPPPTAPIPTVSTPVPPAPAPVAPTPAPVAPQPSPPADAPADVPDEPASADDQLTVVYVLTLDSGRTITITGSGVLGRRPQPRSGEKADHVIEVEDPGRSLSRTHIRFGVSDGSFWVEDAGSANGTWVAAPDGATTQVREGSRVDVVSGGEIRLGERRIVVERWQA
ncbi:FHA domain containing protein [Beutenbergia cavernae DSM 12333]|uniref:FHA domain containing protein n=1 Tax=Beutenbergia cavernae (strain ATCC BAA-8 / DSM 12333 / CCUG 43141 / JCM 11478 / NBRC 16432 / NCIMB 13614 / HKI 0122) TaxID=471853 RepID=C5C0R0_BEUC1|nr:RDD family protein [Beutenbergia cavernae]ACQ81456.1 FHA domain containing protein [Beutenbergia cavernae DSM 12333]